MTTMRHLVGVAFVAVVASIAQGASGATYYVGHDPKFVNITFESQADVETIIGKTNQATGELAVELESDTGAISSGVVSLSVPVESLRTGIEARDGHLRSEIWLDATKFPEITFKSKSVKRTDRKDRLEVRGDFTLHGVTREIVVTVAWKALSPEATKKAGFPEGKWLKLSTDFKVKLSDFGVKIPSMIVSKVSDTWTVKFVVFASTAKVRG